MCGAFTLPREQGLESPHAVARHAAPAAAPKPKQAAAGMHRSASGHGSTADLARAGSGKAGKAGGAAAAAAAAGGEGDGGASRSSPGGGDDTTPPSAGGGKGKGGAAAAYTNPLTNEAGGSGGQAGQAGGARKPPLALHASAGA